MAHPAANQAFTSEQTDPNPEEMQTVSQAADVAAKELKRDLPGLPTGASFSTTESDPSDYQERALAAMAAFSDGYDTISSDPEISRFMSSGPQASNRVTSPMASSTPLKPSARPTRYLSTQEAYDQWASVYDNDGNVLQAIDDLELEHILPSFLESVAQSSPSQMARSVSILDVGCGTGRNTAKLLELTRSSMLPFHITGIDLSKGMLTTAEAKLRPLVALPGSLNLLQHDPFAVSDPQSSALANPSPVAPADALISTLVLEHVELVPYFRALASLLQPGGRALVTNMHYEMGIQTQAGFNTSDGTKIRGTSWAHGVQETVTVAQEEGFELVGEVKERGIEDSMIGKEVGARGSKWIGVKIWYGMVLEKKP